MRKIGSITPIWNQELFIGPHFDMLKSLDRNVVLLGNQPLPQYHNEHGYSYEADRSEKILRELYPHVEIYPSSWKEEFGGGIYNEGLKMMQDYDIVLRLDPDMLWTEKDWKMFIDFIRNDDQDCYAMNFARDSINYYMTGDYAHGLKDAKEFDPLGVNPKYLFNDHGALNYPNNQCCILTFPDDWTCHHFRGWNKPKSVHSGWPDTPYAKEAFAKYSENGKWYKCPEEIKEKMKNWLNRLKEIK